MSGQKQWSEGPSFNPSRFGPVLAVLGMLGFAYVILLFLTELHEEGAEGLLSKLMWRNATVRPPFLLVLIIGGWGVVVRICRSNGLNLDAVLGGRLHATSASYHAALVLLCVVLAFHLLHLIASEVPGITWRPWLTCNLALHAVLLVLGTMPLALFHPEAPTPQPPARRRRERGTTTCARRAAGDRILPLEQPTANETRNYRTLTETPARGIYSLPRRRHLRRQSR